MTIANIARQKSVASGLMRNVRDENNTAVVETYDGRLRGNTVIKKTTIEKSRNTRLVSMPEAACLCAKGENENDTHPTNARNRKG
jgi:hypothetical protein